MFFNKILNGKYAADKGNRIRERDLTRSSRFYNVYGLHSRVNYCLRLIVVDISSLSVGCGGWTFLLQFFSLFFHELFTVLCSA